MRRQTNCVLMMAMIALAAANAARAEEPHQVALAIQISSAKTDGRYPLEMEQHDGNQKYLFEDVAMSEYY